LLSVGDSYGTQATAIGVGAIAEALYLDEVTEAGVHLAEQVIAPHRFLERLAARDWFPRSMWRRPRRGRGLSLDHIPECALAVTLGFISGACSPTNAMMLTGVRVP
jgi:hypothetical protein